MRFSLAPENICTFWSDRGLEVKHNPDHRGRVGGVPRRPGRPVTPWLASIGVGLFCLLLAAPAAAHRLLVFAHSQGDAIHTESKFVGGGPVQNGQVQVQDRSNGQVLVTGRTNAQGKFAFPVPPAAASGRLDLLIVVDGGMGHQGEWLLKADAYLGKVEKTAAASPPASLPVAAAPQDLGSKPAVVDLAALETAIDKSLERHLAPIKAMLAEQSARRTTLPDILGGLGYIAGIFGLAAYFMSKKKPAA